MMLTWKIFVIIIAVASLTLFNVNSSDAPSNSFTPDLRNRISLNKNSSHDPSLKKPRASRSSSTAFGEFMLYDPDNQRLFPMNLNRHNPFRRNTFGHICYKQIRLFCDMDANEPTSNDCVKKAILLYKNNLQTVISDNIIMNLSGALHDFYERFPIIPGNIPLPYRFCQQKEPEFKEKREDCLEELSDFQALVKRPLDRTPKATLKANEDSILTIAKFALLHKTTLGMVEEIAPGEDTENTKSYELKYIHEISNIVTSSNDRHNPLAYCKDLSRQKPYIETHLTLS